MLTRLILIFILFASFSDAHSQFVGGLGGSDVRSNIAYSNLSGISLLPVFQGGDASGDNQISTSLSLSGDNLLFIYGGGKGKGDAIQLNQHGDLSGTSLASVFDGAIGRGDILSSFSTSLDGVLSNEVFQGGNGNGSIVASMDYSDFTGSAISDLFSGGKGRGDYLSTSTQSLNGSTLLAFSGGNGNGDNSVFDRHSSLNGADLSLSYLGDQGRGDIASEIMGSTFSSTNLNVLFLGNVGRGDQLQNQVHLSLAGENMNAFNGASGRGDIVENIDKGSLGGDDLGVLFVGSSGRGDEMARLFFNTALPITLISFDASTLPNSILLEWITLSEINNDYFTVEKSRNGLDWNKVGEVDGGGNSATEIEYQFEDIYPITGLQYYRLKQTDFDGLFEYSQTISVFFQPNNFQVTVYPNPNYGTLNINIENFNSKEVLVRLIDTSGQVVWQRNDLLSRVHTFDISSLPNKVYILQIVANGVIHSQKLIKK
ncbi:MAG: T9SS type A sorting domain-containing protein [Cyclobacteriaceae bacterium]